MRISPLLGSIIHNVSASCGNPAADSRISLDDKRSRVYESTRLLLFVVARNFNEAGLEWPRHFSSYLLFMRANELHLRLLMSGEDGASNFRESHQSNPNNYQHDTRHDGFYVSNLHHDHPFSYQKIIYPKDKKIFHSAKSSICARKRPQQRLSFAERYPMSLS